MENEINNSQRSRSNKDDLYLKIWEIEQRHTTTRWTVSTFFFSISFAIFGISLKTENSILPISVTIFVAVAIFWFTYLLFLRFNDYTNFLRSKLVEMEEKNNTNLNLQSAANKYMARKKRVSATKVIFLSGIFYTVVGIFISVYFN